MATTTTNLGLTKPALSESADVGVINDNSDKIDVEAGKSRANLAATYSASSAYAVGDYCERGGNLYRCTTAIASGGEAWNSGHWTQVAVTGEIPKVIDNLTSTSTSNALSANQGKTLKDAFDGLFSYSSVAPGASKSFANVPNGSLIVFVITDDHSTVALKYGSNSYRKIYTHGTYATISVSSGTVTCTNGATNSTGYALIINRPE